jgi:hypothetical protein
MSKTNIPFPERAGCSVEDACQVLSQGRQATYDDLNLGLLRAIKRGKRTVISVPSVLARARDLGLLDPTGTPFTSPIHVGQRSPAATAKRPTWKPGRAGRSPVSERLE